MFEVGKLYVSVLTDFAYECKGVFGDKGWLHRLDDDKLGTFNWDNRLFKEYTSSPKMVKKCGWINIHSNNTYSSEEKAKSVGEIYGAIATVCVKWEEPE